MKYCLISKNQSGSRGWSDIVAALKEEEGKKPTAFTISVWRKTLSQRNKMQSNRGRHPVSASGHHPHQHTKTCTVSPEAQCLERKLQSSNKQKILPLVRPQNLVTWKRSIRPSRPWCLLQLRTAFGHIRT